VQTRQQDEGVPGGTARTITKSELKYRHYRRICIAPFILWSRRIDESNRIIYKVENTQLVIVQCGGHYGDK
jgi:hypothetical protein